MRNEILRALSKIKLINKYYTGIATIFVLHRVYPADANGIAINERLKVSPEFLDGFISELKRNDYDIISLDRLYEILVNGEKVEKKIVFTLDDGYQDNFTHGYPVFLKNNVPFAVYVTASFPQRSAILWWYILEDLVREHNKLRLSNGLTLSCGSVMEKQKAFLRVREIIINCNKDGFLDNLNELFGHYHIDWYARGDQLAMGWGEIKELGDSRLCTIGGHTLGHFALNTLNKAEIEFEVLEANRLIERELGKKIEHFAYPFGGRMQIGKRESDIIKQYNFKTATTTMRGNIFPEHKYHLECLPRIELHEDFNLSHIGSINRNRIAYF